MANVTSTESTSVLFARLLVAIIRVHRRHPRRRFATSAIENRGKRNQAQPAAKNGTCDRRMRGSSSARESTLSRLFRASATSARVYNFLSARAIVRIAIVRFDHRARDCAGAICRQTRASEHMIDDRFHLRRPRGKGEGQKGAFAPPWNLKILRVRSSFE